MKHLLPVILSIAAACGGVKKAPSGDGDDGGPDAGTTLAPTIVSTTPADGATGVHADATITIAFSAPMDRASVEAAWQSADLADVAFAWNATSDAVVVTPASPLELAEGTGLDPSVVVPRAYTVGLATTATSAGGQPLAAPLSVAFTTQRRLTVGCAAISALTRSMRGDGVVFGETAVTMTTGDTATTNLQLKTFVSFTLPALPSGATLAAAVLAANQNTTVGNPYSMGELIALHVASQTIDATAFAAAPLGNAGSLSDSAVTGAKALDVTDEVADDLATRTTSQFRLELEQPTNNDGIDDEARFSRSGMTLDLTYVVD